jgi:uncharacterized membrane protein
MPSRQGVRFKYVVFAFIAAMMAYVLYHNERFLIDPGHPIWGHYRDLGVFLMVHGIAGGTALILAPMQFSDRLRTRFAKLHRVAGRIYVTAALVLAPFGVYTQWLDERLGLFPTSFTIETIVQASILMITTGIGFIFATKRMIPQHRQWMTRSYAAALTFLEIRIVLALGGWEDPQQDGWIIETVVWCFTATSVLVGDIALQIQELLTNRSRRARAQRAVPQPMAAE